jgi:coproporphyrinogen III oxidase
MKVSSRGEAMFDFVRDLQGKICTALEQVDGGGKFQEINWKRPGGGGGWSRVLEGGGVFEKAGVNVARVEGELPALMREKFGSKSADFFATGVSLVLHPRSPQVPTVHANYRYFEQPDRFWYGGGADLTPYTVDEKSFRHFHQAHQEACQHLSPTAYAEMKKACDEYFHLSHRGESRGIGGIFFDYLSDQPEKTFEFVQKVGAAFIDAYVPIVEQSKDRPFTERQKKFQLLRRGRYVEFNLLFDRGTLFGIQTKGNTESILMSLPPQVHFDFYASLEETDEEKQLMSWLRQPRDWLS